MEAVIAVDIVKGKLHVGASARSAIQEQLRTWPDCRATLTVARATSSRTAAQNAYYWGVVIKHLSDYSGHTPDETHDVLKIMFLPKDVALHTQTGEVVAEFVIGGSTTGLTSAQFSDYVERIRVWAFDTLDVSIPPGDPAWRGTDAEETCPTSTGTATSRTASRASGRV
jgi:hypothetical protein